MPYRFDEIFYNRGQKLNTPVDCRNRINIMTGTTYLIITQYRPLSPNLRPPCSTSSTIHEGPTTHPIRIAESIEMNGIMKLLLM